MHRFFVPSTAFHGEQIQFPAESARQMVQVLRLVNGSKVIALDGSGREALVELTLLSPRQACGVVLGWQENQHEPNLHLTLALALTQREKFEWTLQKVTEVGVSQIVPLVTRRSVVQQVSSALEKYSRWQRIIREAAEQSGRGILPKLEQPKRLPDFIRQRGEFEIGLVAWEGESRRTIQQAVRPQDGRSRAGLLIGPEGGWEEEEVLQAEQAGWLPVSLGRRILRTETAAVVGSALLLTLFEKYPMGGDDDQVAA